jgi:WhiB family transcriptional regulator, redox-sensing transcriptional regulator
MIERDGNPERATGWLDTASCRDVDPDAFFPVSKIESASYDAQIGTLQRVCARCPVALECDSDATGERDGVRAGVDHGAPAWLQARQRAAMRMMGALAA